MNASKTLRHLILVGLALLAFVSCNNSTDSSEGSEKSATPDRPQVVATIGMISDLAAQIAGDAVTVHTIIGAGSDPHVYKHTAQDVKLLQQADLILYNGFHLEGKFGTVLEKMKQKGLAVEAVAEAVIAQETVLKDEEGEDDPHLWMDVSEWRKVAKHVYTLLAQLAPEHADTMEANYNALDLQLDELHYYASTVLETIPASQRYLVTAHDAFGYMESAYGLNVRGIQGLSTESEAGLKDLEELILFLKEKNIPSVFIETSVNDKNVRALVEGSKAQGHVVRIGGELFSDAMGAPGTYEGTYIGMIDHNVTTIANALGGQAPAKGCFQKLSAH